MAQTNWENLPSTNTPLNATNLNKLEDMQKCSTTEKVAGTWIDGKPLYRKVITPTITHTGNSATQTYYVAHNISNVDNILIDVSHSGASDGSPLNNTYYTGNAISFFRRVVPNTTNLLVDVFYTSNVSMPLIVTLLYTKTTDQAPT